ncbi:MAG: hypothetical protein CM1200mP21_02550 [Candidatus Poseidoniales archaeon]|nr:MAG: hypothetical protein CM1200mP21_02550 [Candidatus Poseidoniales archaeon]
MRPLAELQARKSHKNSACPKRGWGLPAKEASPGKAQCRINGANRGIATMEFVPPVYSIQVSRFAKQQVRFRTSKRRFAKNRGRRASSGYGDDIKFAEEVASTYSVRDSKPTICIVR